MNTTNLSTFTVSLNSIAHKNAQDFYRRQSDVKKAKQVYLNTLAVFAVDYYLNCLKIETDLKGSDSWDLVMQTLSNVADLVVKNCGKIECLPVLPNSDMLEIPAEVWSDRIGYVAVQFNQELTEANLLGFIPEVTTDKISISLLQSLDQLILLLHKSTELSLVKLNDIASTSKSTEKPLVKLSQWLENIFELEWLPKGTLFTPKMDNQFMADTSTVIGGERRLNLGMHFHNKEVVLLVNLTPQNELMEIQAQLCPIGKEKYLPANIKLALLTQKNRVIQEVKARSHDYLIQLDKFSYRLGRKLRLQVSLDGDEITQDTDELWTFTEDFMV